MRAIQFSATGGPEVLQLTDVPEPEPGPGEAVVEVGAAGLNFIDTYQRSGLYKVPLPFTLGLEGAGTVAAVGNGVDAVSVGDRVGWTGSPGAYAERALVAADRLVPVPANIDDDTAAGILLQGMTAHYLARDTYHLNPGDKCLIHAGAGGVGLLLTQIAKSMGAEVFTTVGTAEKAELSRAAGSDHVINYNEEDFAAKVTEAAGPNPLAVVYDGVGASVFDASLGLLRKRGMMATYGNASGPVPPVSPLALSAGGSLFLTRPTLFDYIVTREELLARAADLFSWLGSGSLNLRISQRMPLADAAEAHRLLEARLTTGKVVLKP